MMCRMLLGDSQIYLSVDGLPFSLSPRMPLPRCTCMGEAGGLNRILPIKFPLIFAWHLDTVLALTILGTSTQFPSRLHGFET